MESRLSSIFSFLIKKNWLNEYPIEFDTPVYRRNVNASFVPFVSSEYA